MGGIAITTAMVCVLTPLNIEETAISGGRVSGIRFAKRED
jgi:hypothetical protein